ncbi:hypothetical protein [Streptomyces sp. NPDC048516]|uniref:hypothetical protein n=1 Tax=Streptomyces sp. NPDC048516 TaxID=3365565 RepID=UPI00371FCE64
MPLDMTGDARHNPSVHYRRYLDRDNKVTIVCVQNFDYYDYDASRFADYASFDTDLEAQYAPISPDDALDAARELPGDRVAAAQATRLASAIRIHNTLADGNQALLQHLDEVIDVEAGLRQILDHGKEQQ